MHRPALKVVEVQMRRAEQGVHAAVEPLKVIKIEIVHLGGYAFARIETMEHGVRVAHIIAELDQPPESNRWAIRAICGCAQTHGEHNGLCLKVAKPRRG